MKSFSRTSELAAKKCPFLNGDKCSLPIGQRPFSECKKCEINKKEARIKLSFYGRRLVGHGPIHC
jgi:hypothetical protein